MIFYFVYGIIKLRGKKMANKEVTIYKDRYQTLEYAKLTRTQKEKLKLDEVFIKFNGKAVPLTELSVIISSDEKTVTMRKLISIEDLQENIVQKAVCVGTNAEAKLTANDYLLFTQAVPEFKIYTSHSINPKGKEIPYGLKRTLKVEEATEGEKEKYRYVLQQGKWEFVKENDIFYFDGAIIKPFKDLPEDVDLSTIQLFDAEYKQITSVYTGKAYTFKSLVHEEAYEQFNPTTNEKKSYILKVDDKLLTDRDFELDVEGKTITVDSHPVVFDRFYTEQEYVQIEEPKPNSSDMQKVHKRKVRNFQTNVDGKFVALTIHGQVKMVDIENLYDSKGNKVTDLSKMVGKRVRITEGDKVVATSDFLTFEQATRRFDSIKSHQEVSGQATETSLLRLNDGNYVNELESVQPIAYKLADDSSTDFDKLLVEQVVGTAKKYVIVDKDFLRKRPKGFNLSRVKKLKRCAWKDCDVMQSKSQRLSAKDRKTAIEECRVVGKVSFGDEVLPTVDKNTQFESFLTAYKEGNYYLEDVAVGDQIKKIETPGKRYENTDTFYMHDKAADSVSYRALETQDLTFENGKITGKPKYNVGKAIWDSYSKGFKPAVYATAIIPFFGVLPLTAPLSVVAAVGVVGMIPAVPIYHIIKGVFKNNTFGKLKRALGKYKDKTETNRDIDANNIENELKILMNKSSSFTPEQVNDFYSSRILPKVASLYQTTSNNALRMVDGKAKVDSSNVNLAIDQCEEYRENANQRTTCSRRLKRAQSQFDRQQKIMDDLEARGKTPSKFRQKRYDNAKDTLDKRQEAFDKVEADYLELMNATFGEDYKKDARADDFMNLTTGLKVFIELTKFKDSSLWEQFADLGLSHDEIKAMLSFNIKKGLMIDGKSVFDKDLENKRHFKNEGWKKLRERILKACEIESSNLMGERVDKAEVVEEVPLEKIPLELDETISRDVIVQLLTDYLNADEKITTNSGELTYLQQLETSLNAKLEALNNNLKNEDLKEDEKTLINNSIHDTKKSLQIMSSAIEAFKKSIEELNNVKTSKQVEIQKLEPQILEMIESDEELKELYEKYKTSLNIKNEKDADLDVDKDVVDEETPVVEKVNVEFVINHISDIEKFLTEEEKLRKVISDKELEIKQLSKQILEVNAKRIKKEQELRNGTTEEKNKELQEIQSDLEKLKQLREKYTTELKGLETQKTQYNAEINRLEKEIADMKGQDPVIDKIIDAREKQKERADKEVERASREALDAMTRETDLRKLIRDLGLEKDALEAQNQDLQSRLISNDKLISGFKGSMSKVDESIAQIEKDISLIDEQIKAKQKEYDALLTKIENSTNLTQTNKEIEAYQKQLKAISSQISQKRLILDSLKIEAEKFKNLWKEALIPEGETTHEENQKRVEKISELIASTESKLNLIKDLEIKKLKGKKKKEFDANINSEDNLKYLLIDRDSGLFDYLNEQGIHPTDKEIESAIDLIDSKHSEGVKATSRSTKVVNKILIEGQAYITKVLSKGYSNF